MITPISLWRGTQWTLLRDEITSALDNEREHHKAYEYNSRDESNCQGWIEALEYTLGVMDRIVRDAIMMEEEE